MTIHILGIAPYEELNQSMSIISKQFADIHSDIYTADWKEGEQLAARLYRTNYDAIISRGGTAELIRHCVTIPVIDVSISIYDVLSAIRLVENYTKNFAIIGYSSITEKAHLLCNILGYSIKIITLDETVDPTTILDTVTKENYEIILCDAITNRLALSKSLHTVLITSGFESIKQAYQEAKTLSTHLKRIKHENEVLLAGFRYQEKEALIFDEAFQLIYSTISPTLEKTIIHYLSKKNLALTNHYYLRIENQLVRLVLHRFTVDSKDYYNCTLAPSLPLKANSRLDIKHQSKSEIMTLFDEKLLGTKFIPERTKHELEQFKNHYQTFLIWGETGTAKTHIAYYAYLNQELHDDYLITINAKLFDEKTWSYLLNASNGPLVETDNTILFEHAEQFSIFAIERLIMTAKNTKLCQRNRLIFTYDTTHSKDNIIFQRLINELDCASVYAPSIKERKNELNVLITLLINKINILCNKEIIGFEPNAMKEFLAYDWPGNLNQLQAAIKELVVQATSHYISHHQVMMFLRKARFSQNLSVHQLIPFTTKKPGTMPTLFDYTKQIVSAVLEQNNGNQTKTAEQLGISRTTLWRYLKDY